jgi:hypothetical protein
MITQADLDTWSKVQKAIAAEARRLCAQSCGDAPNCRGCNAATHRDWRRDGFEALRKRARVGEIQPGEAFDRFWAAYPRGRKSGKADAKRVFVQIVTGKHRDLVATPHELILGAMRYGAVMGDNHRFVVMPARWLREGRWQDEDMGFGHLSQPAQNQVMTAFDELMAELGGAPVDG